MSQPEMNEELQGILAIVEQRPDGASFSDIMQRLSQPLSQRTLLRRLSLLKEMDKIESFGKKSATRYHIKKTSSLLPLSEKAQSLKEHVSQAIQKRRPVTYNRDFLYRYQPNKTYYLTQTERNHLKKQGQQCHPNLEGGTYLKRILHRLLIDLSWNSSRLEGNTYSQLETEHLIEFGRQAHDRTPAETQMIINHKAAIEFMVECSDKLAFNNYIILNLHGLLSNNLLDNPKARGRLRHIPVGIGGTVYHPLEVPRLIEESFECLLSTAGRIVDPFEQAFFAMVHLPYLQPFEDVNKRVSRLASNIPLFKHNLAPLSFKDVPKDDYISGLLAVYELNKIDLLRDVFLWAYERSAIEYRLSQDILGEPDLFYMSFSKQLKTIIYFIVEQNIRGALILQTLNQWTQNHIEAPHQEQFVRVAEKEIASLHLGNIAIYGINPQLFAKWQIK